MNIPPVSKLTLYLDFGIIICYMNTAYRDETFEVLFCPIKIVSKNKRRKQQDFLYVVWMVFSREVQKRLNLDFTQAAHRIRVWFLHFLYSLSIVKESILVKEILPFSLIVPHTQLFQQSSLVFVDSFSPYRILSSVHRNTNLTH